jgi:hypothetical protein
MKITFKDSSKELSGGFEIKIGLILSLSLN